MGFIPRTRAIHFSQKAAYDSEGVFPTVGHQKWEKAPSVPFRQKPENGTVPVPLSLIECLLLGCLSKQTACNFGHPLGMKVSGVFNCPGPQETTPPAKASKAGRGIPNRFPETARPNLLLSMVKSQLQQVLLDSFALGGGWR